MAIYLIRHGQSEGNRDHLFSGVSDHQLTDLGRSQALAAGEKFKGHRFGSLFTSQLSRAKETADLFLKSSQAVVGRREAIADLNERNFGTYESNVQPPREQQKVGDVFWKICQDVDFIPPEGKSMRQTHMRAIKLMDQVRHEARESDILIISHGNILRSMTLHALGWPIRMLPDIPSENCLVTRLAW